MRNRRLQLFLALLWTLLISFQVYSQAYSSKEVRTFDIGRNVLGELESRKDELRRHVFLSWTEQREDKFVVVTYNRHGKRVTSTFNVERDRKNRIRIREERLLECVFGTQKECAREKPIRFFYDHVEFVQNVDGERVKFLVLIFGKNRQFWLF